MYIYACTHTHTCSQRLAGHPVAFSMVPKASDTEGEEKNHMVAPTHTQTCCADRLREETAAAPHRRAGV